MSKPIQEILAVVVALAVLGLGVVSFLSFVTFKTDLVEYDGGQRASAPMNP